MKKNYLAELQHLLNETSMSVTEINDIISDYDQMYEDGLARGLTDEEVIQYLGEPEKIIGDLTEGYHRHEKPKKGRKLIAVTPFISLVLFFVLGMYFDLWHLSWMAFLLIPVVAIIVETFNKKNAQWFTSISPFIATAIFFILGFYQGLWHPGWLIFFLIPVSGIIGSMHNKPFLHFILALSPFVLTATYMLIGTYAGLWHPTWLMYFLIPMIGVLTDSSLKRKLIYEFLFVLSIGLYLWLGYTYQVWDLSLGVFLFPVAFGILQDDIQFRITKEGKTEFIVFLITLVVYFVCGYFFNTWAYLWLIFLLIPMVAIIRHTDGKSKMVALSPFIATIIFYVLGYFFGLWTISWISFLIIPVIAIIKE